MSALLATRLPSLCAVCGAFGRGRLCAACRAQFAAAVPRCVRCAIRVPAGVDCCGGCLRVPPPQARTVAAVDYAPPWSTLVTRFKFAGALDLAAPLADLLGRALRTADVAPPDLVVPAPLAPARLAERGFNQALELARRVAPALGRRADAALLLRLRETAHQLELPQDARSANVRDAFVVDPLRRDAVRARRVAVVDDVLTTGATAAEMARALLHAGAAEVQVWVVARTPAPGAA